MRAILVGVAVAVCATGMPVQGQPPKAKPPGKTLVEEGHYPKLGVSYGLIREGAYITDVAKDSPAWKAGLEKGDVIMKVDGYTIGIIDGLMFPLQSEVRRVRGTGSFEIKSSRGGKIVTVGINLGESAEKVEPVKPVSPGK